MGVSIGKIGKHRAMHLLNVRSERTNRAIIGLVTIDAPVSDFLPRPDYVTPVQWPTSRYSSFVAWRAQAMLP
jgi:hypothetical protein